MSALPLSVSEVAHALVLIGGFALGFVVTWVLAVPAFWYLLDRRAWRRQEKRKRETAA